MAKENRIKTYHQYHDTVKWPLLLMGLWPMSSRACWYRILPYMQLILCAITVMGMLNFLIHHMKNLKLIIKVISVLISNILVMSRILTILLNQRKILEIHGILTDYCDDIMKDKRLTESAYRMLNKCFTISFIYAAAAFFYFIMLVSPLVITIVIQQIKGSVNGTYVLIYPTIFPWSTAPGSTPYRITQILQLMTASGFWVAIGVDTLMLFYVFQMIAQFGAMSHRLSQAGDSESYNSIVEMCVNRYVSIGKCRDDLQRIFGPVVLMIMNGSAVLICTLIYQLSQATVLSNMQIFRAGFYCMSKSLQIFLLSWAGTILDEESEKYLENVYLSDWAESKITRAIIITISQRPLAMKACGISVINVELFMKIVNTTISYFLLLKTIE